MSSSCSVLQFIKSKLHLVANLYAVFHPVPVEMAYMIGFPNRSLPVLRNQHSKLMVYNYQQKTLQPSTVTSTLQPSLSHHELGSDKSKRLFDCLIGQNSHLDLGAVTSQSCVPFAHFSESSKQKRLKISRAILLWLLNIFHLNYSLIMQK